MATVKFGNFQAMIALKLYGRYTNAEDLQRFIGRTCIFMESSCVIVRATSFTQDGTWIHGTLEPESDLSFSRYEKNFYNMRRPPMDLSLNLDTNSIILKGDPQADCLLSFNFGYFTSRFFYIDELVNAFRDQDKTWFERLTRNYAF